MLSMELGARKPILPPLKQGKKYTLVLDLDETLVHYDEKNEELAIRPYAIEFLDQMALYYEVVIFTAGM